jgi:hypothetical protein
MFQSLSAHDKGLSPAVLRLSNVLLSYVAARLQTSGDRNDRGLLRASERHDPRANLRNALERLPRHSPPANSPCRVSQRWPPPRAMSTASYPGSANHLTF